MAHFTALTPQLPAQSSGLATLLPRRLLALFYAWHLATTARHDAPLIFGIPMRTADVLAETGLGRLMSIAAVEAVNLTTRWSHCDAYWRALAGAVERADRAHLRRLQLSGLQLEAAAQLP